jgi:hypothetical protein
VVQAMLSLRLIPGGPDAMPVRINASTHVSDNLRLAPSPRIHLASLGSASRLDDAEIPLPSILFLLILIALTFPD